MSKLNFPRILRGGDFVAAGIVGDAKCSQLLYCQVKSRQILSPWIKLVLGLGKIGLASIYKDR